MQVGYAPSQPIEIAIDAVQAIEAEREFFVNQSVGTDWGCYSPDCIMSAVHTANRDLPLSTLVHGRQSRGGERVQGKERL